MTAPAPERPLPNEPGEPVLPQPGPDVPVPVEPSPGPEVPVPVEPEPESEPEPLLPG
jgi:hypothetical protein